MLYAKLHIALQSKLKILFIIIFLPVLAHSQNLVSNHGFENTVVKCASKYDKVIFANETPGWTLPSSGTSDIINYPYQNIDSCLLLSPDRWLNTNRYAELIPYEGNCYAGFSPFTEWGYANQQPSAIRKEYLQNELVEPLEIGATYCVEYFIARAPNNYLAVGDIGVYFSENKVDTSTSSFLPFVPQVIETEIITDTNWVQIKSCFIADKSYTYFIIGNFKSNNTINKISGLSNRDQFANYSYYYIDNISIEKITDQIVIDDTIVCKNTNLSILALKGGLNYQWYLSGNPSSLLGTKDSVSIYVTRDEDLVVSTSFCSCPTIFDTVHLSIFPYQDIDLGKDTSFCENTEVRLDVYGPFNNILWSDGTSGNTNTIADEGNVWVEAYDTYNCLIQDTIFIQEILLPAVNLGSDKFLCEPFRLSMDRSYDQYLWNDVLSDSTYYVVKSGRYWVKVQNVCGEAFDTIIVRSEDDLRFSNLITPNDDGLNDTYEIEGTLPLQNGYLEIYNRWGERVYINESYSNDWSGKDVQSGIYYLYYKYDTCFEYKGWVQVLH